MLLFPADRATVASVEDALRYTLEGARRAFDLGLDEMAAHLLTRPYRLNGSDERELLTVIAPGGLDVPMPVIHAARALAATIECEAAIWVVPGASRTNGLVVCLERPGSMERAFHAKTVADREYVLGAFEEQETRALYELAYVALPQNVIEYAKHFGDNTRWFGPTALELEAAKRAVERKAA